MGLNITRIVEIEISNDTQNITLENPRIHFFSGYSLNCIQSPVAPGSSDTYKFTNKSLLWGCNGILAFEAKSFTLAIYFSNPIDYNRFSPEMGLELSLDKVHKGDLQVTYERLVRLSRDSSNKTPMFPSVILKENQEEAKLSIDFVKVKATMSGGRSAVIKVLVEDWDAVSRGRGAVDKVVKEERGALREEAGIETPRRGKRYSPGRRNPGRHYQEN